MEFGNLLLMLLKEQHMSQRKLADRSGVSYVTINRLIKGHSSRISRVTVEKLASGLGCTGEQRDELLRAAGRVPDEVETKFAESPFTARLFRQINELDKDEISELLRELEERASEKKSRAK